MATTWDASVYRANSSAQLRHAQELLARLTLRGDERVLDVGCGDGQVTALLATLVPAGTVVGVDASPAMIELASREHPDVRFEQADATALPFVAEFDVVVSFTALHWVRDRQLEALRSIHAALVPGGRFVTQFPGAGNIAGLLRVADAVCDEPAYRAAFAGFAFPWLFPDAAGYRASLAAAGFVDVHVALFDREVAHAGAAGLAGWIRATWMPFTEPLAPDARQGWIARVVDRYLTVAPADAEGVVRVPSTRLEAGARRSAA